MIHVDNPKNKG